jgi:hypothetical protein
MHGTAGVCFLEVIPLVSTACFHPLKLVLHLNAKGAAGALCVV